MTTPFYSLIPPEIIPLTESPVQSVSITLNGQACLIRIYTKSINVPVLQPGQISTDPPVYENVNPVFLDLFVDDALVVGGVECHNQSLTVIDQYLGFVGDLAMIDTEGDEDPVGVSTLLPPVDLMNEWQRNLPLSLAGRAPAPLANKIPGLGKRFQLTYWANLR